MYLHKVLSIENLYKALKELSLTAITIYCCLFSISGFHLWTTWG